MADSPRWRWHASSFSAGGMSPMVLGRRRWCQSDPLQRCAFHGVRMLARPARVGDLGLVPPDDRLGQCVVAGVPGAAHGGFHIRGRQPLRVPDRWILCRFKGSSRPHSPCEDRHTSSASAGILHPGSSPPSRGTPGRRRAFRGGSWPMSGGSRSPGTLRSWPDPDPGGSRTRASPRHIARNSIRQTRSGAPTSGGAPIAPPTFRTKRPPSASSARGRSNNAGGLALQRRYRRLEGLQVLSDNHPARPSAAGDWA